MEHAMTTVKQPERVFRFRAHNAATESENKIHDDQVAAAYGFRGALVPGVTVYGYMIPAVLDRLGHAWLERGNINVRLLAPCYEGDIVLARCDGSIVSAEREDGSSYASGVVAIADDVGLAEASIPDHPLPEADQRPIASASSILPGTPLGTIQSILDVDNVEAIPERLLRMANEILVRNFRMSPWIHAGSEVHHRQLARCGEEVAVRGVIDECFERKGRRFAVAALEMSAERGNSCSLLATVRHTFIYELKA